MNSPIRKTLIIIESGHLSTKVVSGGDLLMQAMAPYLKKQHQLKIVLPAIALRHWKRKKGITFHPIPPLVFEKSTRPLSVFLTYIWRIFHTTPFLLKQSKPYILYSSTNILPDVLPAYFARTFQSNTNWVARIHHLIPSPAEREGKIIVNTVSYLMQKLTLLMIKIRADLIIALNDKLKAELLRKKFPKTRVKVLGAGINFKQITSVKPAAKTSHYDGIFLGRLHPTKGIFDLVPIWKKVVKELPQAKLAVIGGGQEYLNKYMQKVINEQELTKNISLLGFLPDSEVYSLMKRAKVFLFTDHEAGWGLAVAEAMACGLPVVGYDNGVLGTVYKKGFKLVPLGDHRTFAQETAELLQNDFARKKLASAAKNETSNLNWDKTAEKFGLIIDKLHN